MAKIRVAVIGAGPSGLCVLRHLTNDPDIFDVTCFERQESEGGLWNYSDLTGVDKYSLPVPHALYETLVTNLPRQIMCLPGFDFSPDLPSFVHQTVVKKYLMDYSENFQLRNYIKFQRLVVCVKPSGTPDCRTWFVTTRDMASEKLATNVFDSVVVSNGCYQYPKNGALPDLDKFRGLQVHSKDYRGPEIYKDKNVLLLGSSFSALDFVTQIRGTARKIYTIERPNSLLKIGNLAGVEPIAPIKQVLTNGVVTANGDCREVDIIYSATGFHTKFPFLAPECDMTWKNDRITPLHRHMVHVKTPSLIFVGFTKRAPQFPVIDLQSRYACALLKHEFTLPPEEEMLRQEEEDYQSRVSRGLPEYMAHDLSSLEALLQYTNQLSEEAGIHGMTDKVVKLLRSLGTILSEDTLNVKNYEFTLHGDDWLVTKRE